MGLVSAVRNQVDISKANVDHAQHRYFSQLHSRKTGAAGAFESPRLAAATSPLEPKGTPDQCSGREGRDLLDP